MTSPPWAETSSTAGTRLWRIKPGPRRWTRPSGSIPDAVSRNWATTLADLLGSWVHGTFSLKITVQPQPRPNLHPIKTISEKLVVSAAAIPLDVPTPGE